jgi:putative ABC transport system permease protein
MLRNYFLIAVQVLMRRKFFTFISLFGITFTLMVLTVATAFMDHVFGSAAPETRLDRTLGVFSVRLINPDRTGSTSSSASYQFLDKYVRTLPSVEKVSVFTQTSEASTYKNGEEIKFYLKYTDGEFWEIMDFRFREGRPLTRDDEKKGNFVAVINQATRQKLFGEEPALGKFIPIDGQTFRVVGIVENVSFLRISPFADVWVPISTHKSSNYKEADFLGNFYAAILAKDPKDLPLIKADYQTRVAQVELPNPKEHNLILSFAETFFDSIARQMLGGVEHKEASGTLKAILLLIAFLFMVLPTINLVNINVSRIAERASEIGVRKAFGASSWTLVGQFVTENVLLTLVGGLLGFVLSFLVIQYINHTGWIAYLDLRLNFRVFGYGLFIIVFFGVFSGVYPAWRMSRMNPVEALKGGAK